MPAKVRAFAAPKMLGTPGFEEECFRPFPRITVNRRRRKVNPDNEMPPSTPRLRRMPEDNVLAGSRAGHVTNSLGNGR